VTVRAATYREARTLVPASMRLSIVTFVDGRPDLRDWTFKTWSEGVS
jgi:hypothetical protein